MMLFNRVVKSIITEKASTDWLMPFLFYVAVKFQVAGYQLPVTGQKIRTAG
jgi:hypothetical protein